MLQTLQHNILNKLATTSDLKQTSKFKEQDLKDLIQSVLPLGFSRNKQHIQNLSVILNKTLCNVESVQIFDKFPHLVDLFISLMTFWLTEPLIKKEVFVIQTLVELLDAMVYSQEFWARFKSAPILHTFIQT